MNRDSLYFHYANMALVVIGLLSIQKVLGPVITALLILGSVGGFLFSWYMRNSRPPHIDTFIGMLSLASVVAILSRLHEIDISFENLIRIFSTALAWLSLFQAFGLRGQKSYSLVQFISVALLVSSVSLAIEEETVYVLYLTGFLFILIFTMRLALVCEKQQKGSFIIGNREEIMSLWHQIKVGTIMFSIVLILAALVYPAVPRFHSIPLNWIPSTLMGLPAKVPVLKLLQFADITIKDAKVKKEQIVDDGTKKRETREDRIKETTERFNSSDFNKEIDGFKVESLTIRSDKNQMPLDQKAQLSAELKLTDGSVVPATKLVDWKVTGTGQVSIDKDGILTPKETGSVQVSATYMGAFSNDVNIKVTERALPIKKRGFLFYLIVLLLWILALGLVIFSIFIFIRSQRLIEMLRKNPKEFIKEVYYSLCRGFKIYGMPKFDYVSYREFYNSVKGLIGARPEPMQELTEEFLEARFSAHEISAEHSKKAIGLFHDIKNVLLQKEDRSAFWKSLLFRVYLLDILLISRQ